MTRQRAAATALLTFTVAGSAASVVFADDGGEVGFPLVFMVYAGVGWLVARSQPVNRGGWLLLSFGAIGGVNGVAASWPPIAAALQLPGGLFTVLAAVGNAFQPFPLESGGANPYAIPAAEPALRAMTNAAGVALVLSLGGGVAALVVRFRQADTAQRQQLKWFMFAAACLPVAVLLGEANQQSLQPVAVPVGLGLLAGAVGIAILRHGLFDIDRLISRTVGWGLVTLVIAGVYLAAVTTLSAATASVAGDSTLAVAASMWLRTPEPAS